MTGSRRRRAPTLTFSRKRGRVRVGAAWVTAVWLLILPGLLGSAVSGAEPPPGASSCSGCHPLTASAETKVPPLRGQNPADIAAAMKAFQSGERPSTVMGRIAKGFSDGEIRAITAWVAEQR